MEIVQCRACGSQELQLSNGLLICVYCRSRHLPDITLSQTLESHEEKSTAEGLDKAISYDVVIEDLGKKKIAVLNVLQDIVPMKMQERSRLVHNLPQTLIGQVTFERAHQVKEQLEIEGAKISIIEKVGVYPIEKQTSFDVVLEEVGKRKMLVTSTICNLTPLKTREAMAIVENLPQPIMSQVSIEVANRVKKKLENLGATISIR